MNFEEFRLFIFIVLSAFAGLLIGAYVGLDQARCDFCHEFLWNVGSSFHRFENKKIACEKCWSAMKAETEKKGGAE